MNEQNAKVFMELLGVHNGEKRGEWFMSSCPLAFHRHRKGKDNSPSFGIHLADTSRSGYHCFSCGIRSRDLTDLLIDIQYALQHPAYPPQKMELGLAHELAERENELGYFETDWTGKPPQKDFIEFPEWWLSSFKSVFEFPAAMQYIASRNVSHAVVKALDLRYDTGKKAICFPLRDLSGRLGGMRGRYIKPKGGTKSDDYKWNGISNSSLLLLGEQHIDFMKPIVVVEGEFDYARVFTVYRNVVANLTASFVETKVKKLETAVSVVGFFDDDEAGVIASETLRARLKSSYVSVKYPDTPWVDEKGDQVADPGAMTNEQIVQLIAPHVEKIDKWLS